MTALTPADREALIEALVFDSDGGGIHHDLVETFATVETILAARLAAVTALAGEWERIGDQLQIENPKAMLRDLRAALAGEDA